MAADRATQAKRLVLLLGAVALLVLYVCTHPVLCERVTFAAVQGSSSGPWLPRGANCLLGHDPAQRAPSLLLAQGARFDAAKRQQEPLHNCVLSSWNVYHFLAFFAAGLLAPDLWWLALGLGTVWELLEWRLLDCHDAMDLVMNAAGYFSGAALARMRRSG